MEFCEYDCFLNLGRDNVARAFLWSHHNWLGFSVHDRLDGLFYSGLGDINDH